MENSLGVQWLGLCASTAGVPGPGTIHQAEAQQKNKQDPEENHSSFAGAVRVKNL